jgi:hypothetical protein
MNNKRETDYGAPTPGWFLSHWRGETSLGISYWLNGILLGSLLPTVILIGYSPGPSRRRCKSAPTKACSNAARLFSAVAHIPGRFLSSFGTILLAAG